MTRSSAVRETNPKYWKPSTNIRSNYTDEQKLKKLNLTKPRWSSFKVFFTLKTMPLSVFRYQVLRLSTEELIFICYQMEQR